MSLEIGKDYVGARFDGNNWLEWNDDLTVNADIQHVSDLLTKKAKDRLKKLLTPDQIVELELEKLHEEMHWSGDSNVVYADRRATESEEDSAGQDAQGVLESVLGAEVAVQQTTQENVADVAEPGGTARPLITLTKAYKKLCKQQHQKNQTARALVVRSIAPHLQCHVQHCKYAYDAIEAIRTYWNQNTSQSCMGLREKITQYVFEEQMDSLTMVLYLEKLARQLNSLGDMSFTVANLPVVVLEKLDQRAEYNYLAEQIRNMDNYNQQVIKLDKLKKMLITKEGELAIARTKSGALAVKSSTQLLEQTSQQGGVMLTQSDIQSAFVAALNMVGRKKNFIPKRCENCNFSNHTIAECWFDGGGAVNKRPSNWKHSGVPPQRAGVSQEKRPRITSLVAHVIALNSQTNLEQLACDDWILDSGCNAFLTNDAEILFNRSYVSEAWCQTADGSTQIEIVGKGSVAFKYSNEQGEVSYLIVEEVRFVPSLRYNLFPINKLMEKGLFCAFSGDTATISKNGKVEGTGTLQTEGRFNGLYLMNLEPVPPEEVKHLQLVDNIQLDRMQMLYFVSTSSAGPCYVVDDYSGYSWAILLNTKDQVAANFEHLYQRMVVETSQRVNTVRSDQGGEFLSGQFTQFCLDKGILNDLVPRYTPQLNGVVERFNRCVVEGVTAMMLASQLPRTYWGYAVLAYVYAKNRILTSGCNAARDNQVQPYEIYHGIPPKYDDLQVWGSKVQFYVPAEARKDKFKFSPRTQSGHFLGYVPSGYYILMANQAIVTVPHGEVIFDSGIQPASKVYTEAYYREMFRSWDERTVRDLVQSSPYDVTTCRAGTDPAKASQPDHRAIMPTDSLSRSQTRHQDSGATEEISYQDSSAGDTIQHQDSGVRGPMTCQDSGRNDIQQHQDSDVVGTMTRQDSGDYDIMQHQDSDASVSLRQYGSHIDLLSPPDPQDRVQANETTYSSPNEGLASSHGLANDSLRHKRLKRLKKELRIDMNDCKDAAALMALLTQVPQGQDVEPLKDLQTELLVESIIDSILKDLENGSMSYGHPNVTAPYQQLVDMPVTPKTIAESKTLPEWPLWKQAIESELQSLIKNGTWIRDTLPSGRKALPCKWIFKIKLKSDGSIESFKARLVIQGFRQIKDVDYNETFAPVAKFNTIRLVLAVAAYYDLEIDQMDFCTAFLNGKLNEEIFMKGPAGSEFEGQLLRLLKSLYGLNQAPKCWNNAIHQNLIQIGFKRCYADNCLYIRVVRNQLSIIVLYVDDVLIVCKSREEMDVIKVELSSKFDMKDLGKLEHIVGIRIRRDRIKKLISLDQSAYLERVLDRFGMDQCHPVTTPIIERGARMKLIDECEDYVNYPFRALIGSLMYLMVGTRPEIAYAVSQLSKSLENPSQQDVVAAKRVLRYLKGTVDLSLILDGNLSLAPVAYADADYANDPQTRRSTTGYLIMMCGAAVAWKSKLQSQVALSSTEAEYYAASFSLPRDLLVQRNPS
ncbi:hypothetical protein MIR68_006540 [Amoeboaphelidium protococcarum]|nr:hypothetical protein MIR68_006540 [Amoeboaphelidium protococcarum]